MPFERTGAINRTPKYLQRQKSSTNVLGYLVEGAGVCNGFYVLKGKTYKRQGSDGRVEIRKLRKSWVIHIQDEDGEWQKYFSNQQPKLKPPESGWKNAFDNAVDDDVKITRTLFKNLSEKQLEAMQSGESVPDLSAAAKLGADDAKPETPQQRRARERLEKRKAKMEARRKGKSNKNKASLPKKKTKIESKEEEQVEASSATKSEAFTTPEKSADEEIVEGSRDILDVLFGKLQPRYAKYRSNFVEFGVSDLEMLKEVDSDALGDLGVTSVIERKVMIKMIQKIIKEESTGGSEVPASPEDIKAHKSMKLKRTQLQNIRLKANSTSRSEKDKA